MRCPTEATHIPSGQGGPREGDEEEEEVLAPLSPLLPLSPLSPPFLLSLFSLAKADVSLTQSSITSHGVPRIRGSTWPRRALPPGALGIPLSPRRTRRKPARPAKNFERAAAASSEQRSAAATTAATVGVVALEMIDCDATGDAVPAPCPEKRRSKADIVDPIGNRSK